MPCNSMTLTIKQEIEKQKALERLREGLSKGTVSVVVGRGGSLAFKGWSSPLYADLCAYRKLASENYAPMRMALARAEALAGRKLDPLAVGSGLHSHDGGATWSRD